MASDSVGPGTLLGGDFRLIEPLSSGGMGALFVAEQISTGRRRAVKVMHAGLLDSPVLRERFAREARVGSLVRSSHVVEVVAAGVDPVSSAPWIAMELLEGEDLSAHISRVGALSTDAALRLLRPICHALGAAHSAGVVHRDIKPENVFICATQSAGVETSVKVLDFGIARIAEQMRTAHTGVIGTPLWMAPEQTDPSAEAGPAADVWALGLLTFWLLTARHFWRSAAIPSSSMHALMREILFDPMPSASERAREIGAAERVPPGFDAWFARAVARDPSARFANADEAFRALVPVLEGAQPSAPAHPVFAATIPHSTPTLASAQVSKPPSRLLWLAFPLLAFGALLVGGAGLGAAYYAGLLDAGEVEIPRSPSVPPSASTQAPPLEAEPTPSAAPTATATTIAPNNPIVDKTAPTATPKPSASGTASSTPSAPKPFDTAAAQQSINQRASLAKLACSSRPGPRAFSASVSFRNDGSVLRVSMSPQDMATSSGICVFSTFSGARVPAYDGPVQSAGASVVLN